MKTAISFSVIEDVQVGTPGTAIISGQDFSGVEAEVIVKAADVPKVANPLLYCAAITNSDLKTSTKPLPGTIIPDWHLPVMSWRIARSNNNRGPLLILRIPGRITLTFQFSPEDARDCGDALSTEGLEAALEP